MTRPSKLFGGFEPTTPLVFLLAGDPVSGVGIGETTDVSGASLLAVSNEIEKVNVDPFPGVLRADIVPP